jgi:phage shock protein E
VAILYREEIVMRSMLIALALAGAAPALAQPAANPQIDFAGFTALTREVQAYRQDRLLSWAELAAAARDPHVLLLDARSESAFAEGHIEGAVNLPLPDFTADSLARVIGPGENRRILIYCNNNFSNNTSPVTRKLITVALNIQTFINLYGYGYRNVHELGEVIDFNDPRVPWVANTDT